MKGKKNENAIIGHRDLCEWYWHANETDTTSCTNETNAMLSTISTWKTDCKNIGLFAFLSRKIFLRDINQVKNIERKKKKKVGRGSGENIVASCHRVLRKVITIEDWNEIFIFLETIITYRKFRFMNNLKKKW